ncbi:MAG: hypothetical protein ACWGHH_08175 [Sulfurovaceae bacterium]
MIASKKRDNASMKPILGFLNKRFLFSLIILVLFLIGLSVYRGYSYKAYGAKEKSKQEPQCQKCQTISKISPQTPIYFTLSDPNKKDQSRGGMHSHGGDYKNESYKAPSKKAWLVFGENDLVSGLDLKTFVFDTKQMQKDVKLDNKMGVSTYSFEVPKNGYYNLFAESEIIDDDTLFYRIAKLEYLNGKHGSKDVYNEDIKKELKTDKIKIDLLRLKDKNEKSFFYNTSMGDTLKFKATLNGKPLQNADLSIDLNSGWSKNIKTDANGTASFTMIRDYFPSWDKFDKRYKQEMLLTLTFSEDKNGTMDDQKYKKVNYTLTYPLSYYPNGSDYQSYGYGLLVGLFIFVLSGIVVYLYRRNRTKPFKEIKYEE